MPELGDFFAIVSVDEEGNETIMSREAEEQGKTVVVPMVTTNDATLRHYKELAKKKILETGEVIRIVHFKRIEAMDIGDHDRADSE